MKRQDGRGQATVELALGSLVFVSVLLFGVYFAEFGTLKLRVQQAAASALFDATGMRSHNFKDGASPRFKKPAQLKDDNNKTAAQRAKRAYRDFDAAINGSSTVRMSITRGARLNVNCSSGVLPLSSPRGSVPSGATTQGALDIVAVGYDDLSTLDTLDCNASATIDTFRMPDRFMDRGGGQGYFKGGETPTDIKVCAFGRAARDKTCKGRVRIAIDDWGLGGTSAAYGSEWAICQANGATSCLWGKTTGNQAFRAIVERMYEEARTLANLPKKSSGSSPLHDFLARLYPSQAGVIPADERDFRFVFVGENGDDGRPFQFKTQEANRVGAGAQDGYWPASPYSDRYREGYRTRGRCFLGSKCTRPIFK